jgi:hypothetical protein
MGNRDLSFLEANRFNLTNLLGGLGADFLTEGCNLLV